MQQCKLRTRNDTDFRQQGQQKGKVSINMPTFASCQGILRVHVMPTRPFKKKREKKKNKEEPRYISTSQVAYPHPRVGVGMQANAKYIKSDRCDDGDDNNHPPIQHNPFSFHSVRQTLGRADHLNDGLPRPAPGILAIGTLDLLGTGGLLGRVPGNGPDDLVRDALNLITQVRLSLVVGGRRLCGRSSRSTSLLDASAGE